MTDDGDDPGRARLVLLVVATVLAVHKLRGMTWYERRKRHERRRGLRQSKHEQATALTR